MKPLFFWNAFVDVVAGVPGANRPARVPAKPPIVRPA
jgi:hypothetical protein